jgi:glycosyltransferase involved in cell wall biosynthesis
VAAQLLALDVYLHLDSAGPAARKSSLATALGLGLAIVATEGPETWPVLRAEGAVRLVPPRVADLVAAVTELLDDPAARAALQARATACYDAHASLDHALAAYRTLLSS